MKFTTPCFIRKNTPEIRKKLEELGYTFLQNGHIEWHIPISDLPYLQCNTERGFSYYIGKNGWMEGIDCGENEQLFLALAALRDDTDRFQWFCDDDGRWERSEDDVPSKYMQMNGHKATVEELVKHFNGRK